MCRQLEQREQGNACGIVGRRFDCRAIVNRQLAMFPQVVGDLICVGILAYKYADAQSAFNWVEVVQKLQDQFIARGAFVFLCFQPAGKATECFGRRRGFVLLPTASPAGSGICGDGLGNDV